MTSFDQNAPSPSRRLTFLEEHILYENMCIQGKAATRDKAGLVSRLVNLMQNTSEPILLAELQALNDKIMALSESEYEQLRKDVIEGTLLSEPSYKLPELSLCR